MQKVVQVSFPGGKKVDAQIGEIIIKTDQPVHAGGESSAPQPFELFLASLATCAGIYAVSFCQSRQIQFDNMSLNMICDFDPLEKRYTKMTLELQLPDEFPDKYKDGIVRSMDLCTVKKHIMNPPVFKIITK